MLEGWGGEVFRGGLPVEMQQQQTTSKTNSITNTTEKNKYENENEEKKKDEQQDLMVHFLKSTTYAIYACVPMYPW